MPLKKIHSVLNYCIATVWLINGLFCKVLGLVPRHEQIVAGILGTKYARPLTVLTGLSEVAMAIWIISRLQARLNAVIQMVIIAIMNVLEFLLVPHLLLWGKFNAVFAALFILLIYYNEFILGRQSAYQQ